MRIIKALWIGAMVVVLCITLYAFDGKPNSDIGIFLVWSGLFLSFPVGLLVPLVHVVLYESFSIAIETSYLSLVLDWLGFCIVGYLQWFMFAPYLIGKLRSFKQA